MRYCKIAIFFFVLLLGLAWIANGQTYQKSNPAPAVDAIEVAPFHLVFAETPVGSGYGQPVERYQIKSVGVTAHRLSDIPKTMTDDPAGVTFRNPLELFVGNRSAHSGNSSVMVFYIDESLQTFTQGPVITGNSVSDVHQIAFNPVDGELFVTNWRSGLMSRFTFDPQGKAVPNGTISMPDPDEQLGVAIRKADEQLFVSSYTFVRRFTRDPGGTYTYVSSFSMPGATHIHFMKFLNDELYVCDIQTSSIYRYNFDANGDPVPNGVVSGVHPVDVAFSPDGREMFVPNHIDGGISRYEYDAVNDDWIYTSTMATPQLGGVAIAPKLSQLTLKR